MPDAADELDAGDLGGWLAMIDAVHAGQRTTADVACGSCDACCRASQFIPVGPDERDALAHIPPQLLFAAPGGRPGHRVLGYDEHGCCPMLGESGCTIYEHRPRACRSYDCRAFTVAGLVEPLASEPGRRAVAERAARWRFETDAESQREQDAVRRVAAELGERPELLGRPGVAVPLTALAVLAVELRHLARGEGAEGAGTAPFEHLDPAAVRAALAARSEGSAVTGPDPAGPPAVTPRPGERRRRGGRHRRT